MTATPPGFLIAAPASGAGKTTVALGLMRALTRSGIKVQPFKCGPDYIDPAFHRAACGRPSYNLDAWAMDAHTLAARIAGAARGAELAVAEASMGLFDGVARPGLAGIGASADIAGLTGWPVVLVLDVSGQAQSAAATASGFAGFREGVDLAGVILNKVASPRHEALVRAGMDAAGIKVLGVLPRRRDLALPERHLGLVQAEEHAGLEPVLEALADLVAEGCDMAAIRNAARRGLLPEPDAAPLPPPGQRIALARDAAFSFVYPHLIDAWRASGAEIVPFSPLADEAPDPAADVAWLPGGYPELHAGRLAAGQKWRAALRRFAETRPVHGECGGYMAMGAALIDAEGHRHRMAGLFGLVTSFARRRMHLGYRRARLLAPMPGLPAGTVLRGHEFHYATIVEAPDAPLAHVQDANGDDVPETGARRGRATGSFFHMIGPECAP